MKKNSRSMKSFISPSFLFSLVVLLAFSSCKKNEVNATYYTGAPVFISLSTLSYAELPAALNQGSFVTIRSVTTSGANNTKIRISNGVSTNDYVPAAIDYKSFRFGIGGIIVGTNYMGEPLAYDLACPNCRTADYRLSVRTDGTCSCSHCNIVYDMNNYGFISNTEKNTLHAEPRGLLRYRADVTVGVVHVWN